MHFIAFIPKPLIKDTEFKMRNAMRHCHISYVQCRSSKSVMFQKCPLYNEYAENTGHFMSTIFENMAKGREREVTFTSLSQLMVHLPSRALHCVDRCNGKDMKQMHTLMLFISRYLLIKSYISAFSCTLLFINTSNRAVMHTSVLEDLVW